MIVTMRGMLTVQHVALIFALTTAAESFALGETSRSSTIRFGVWHAWLDSPGGELSFGLEISRQDAGVAVWLRNGSERISVPRAVLNGSELLIDMEHYDSVIRAELSADGRRLDGRWTKRSGPEKWAQMPFHATLGDTQPPNDLPTAATVAAITGRWSVRFSSGDEPAVGVFDARPDGSVTGTFLTTTGDYRYLAGRIDNAKGLTLSCFDGAHAFLFTARVQPDDTLTGDFWSRDTWHETWTAVREAGARLPDAFAQTRWIGSADLFQLVFPDLTGKSRSLADPEFSGRARIIEVFGSWCPNCNDATHYLVELDRRYRSRGLSIVGLAFELTGDFRRDARQVGRFAKRHDARFPMLIAGVSDKSKATQALGVLDRIRSYPTTIFLHADGRVRAVHSGFAGPATGGEHELLRKEFEDLIEELLAESASADR